MWLLRSSIENHWCVLSPSRRHQGENPGGGGQTTEWCSLTRMESMYNTWTKPISSQNALPTSNLMRKRHKLQTMRRFRCWLIWSWKRDHGRRCACTYKCCYNQQQCDSVWLGCNGDGGRSGDPNWCRYPGVHAILEIILGSWHLLKRQQRRSNGWLHRW